LSAAAIPRSGAALAALTFGNFAIGTGVLIVAGMLNELAFGLAITVPAAGQLITAAATALCIAAPLAAAFTSRFDRRVLLTLSLGWYAIGLALSALVEDYWLLLIVRVVTVIPAAIFTPQAATTAGLLAAPERRSGAITTVFLGWSIASVAGLPLGTWIAGEFGWRVAFALAGVLAGIAAVTVAATIPAGLRVEPMTRATWLQVARHPALMLVLLVTAVQASGQFVMFAYIAPWLTWALGAGAGERALLLAVFGACGVIGNAFIARRIDRLGPGRAVRITLVAIGLGALLLTAARLAPALAWGVVAVSLGIWGFGTFSGNSAQQARLATLAPPLASASIALNSSGIYIGQAIGGAVGGALIAGFGIAVLPWAAVVMVSIALALSRAADRRTAA
jgi:predicted MFS family arabinose efflux permease